MTRLFLMLIILCIALLASLYLKKSCSSPIIYLFLFMAKVYYFVVLLLQYSDNQRVIKHFSLFYFIKYSLAKLEYFL